MKKRFFIYTSLLCFISHVAVSADVQEHEAIKLWQQHAHQSAQQRREQQTVGDDRPKTNEITLAGESFEVEHNMDAVGQALYIAINQQLWQYVEKFLPQYESFPEHKLELVWFAKGALAREKGHLKEAEANYRALLQAEPDFLRGQLDLARILFENKKNIESTALFNKIAIQDLPEGVLATIKDYQQALANRESWQGALTFGYQYNENINQSSQKSVCLLYNASQCIVNQRAPDSVNAGGWRYDLSLQRRISLSGHHGIEFYLNSYGQFYPNHHEYNENTAKVYAGYNYQNADTSITVAPLAEFNTFGNNRHYHALGGHIDWTQNISPRNIGNIQFEQKKQYFSDHYTSLETANLISLFATWYHLLTPKTTVFSGVDWLHRNTTDKTQAYHMAGIRLGISYQFDSGLNTTLLALLRRYDYQEYHAVLGEKRRDNQQIYLAILRMPQWRFYGMTPNILVRHTRNKSNADYVYSYKQTEVQLNLEWYF
ncbi:uncharacterized protein DUF560 [Cricetibacter osteomyelitidis]|uniref:Uncharacterized protein DUF560 n=1 Tax=Cricetibacter osteomyelitidis TaxID=1521931 RepID=A0A4R2TIU2_9PAST|nr:surface lipoprotein assembly modifier [Cricetibacter osteomyelitidis]TCP94722.1 uncharacterized protein DUF560 [Cricetibacter osteomyelitidis]